MFLNLILFFFPQPRKAEPEPSQGSFLTLPLLVVLILLVVNHNKVWHYWRMLRFYFLPYPGHTAKDFPFFLFFMIILFYFFLILGSIADSNTSVLDFETSTKVRRPRSQAPCFYKWFYARTLHTEQLCFLFPHPLTPETRTRKAIQFPPPVSQWQHVVLGVTLRGMVTSKIDLYITLFLKKLSCLMWNITALDGV